MPRMAKRPIKFILKEINQVLPLCALITTQKLSYIGRIRCVEDDRLKKPIMIRMSECKWTRRRPHMRWTDEIKDTTKLTMDELREVTRDMISWKQLIVGVTKSCTT